ncbi:hypothetical protein PMAYCL1PPCAC_01080, partial [Pristionchus mayeri]
SMSCDSHDQENSDSEINEHEEQTASVLFEIPDRPDITYGMCICLPTRIVALSVMCIIFGSFAGGLAVQLHIIVTKLLWFCF